ncbi:MAG: acyltransferase [Rhizobiaceae bacterium]
MENIASTPVRETRIVYLDVLRLFAALVVVAFHWLFRGHAAGEQAAGFGSAASLAMYGYIGVDWFFIISGFVIAWTAQGRDALTFAVSRFARIYPGYIACMTLTFILTVAYGWQHASPGLADWIANLTLFAPLVGRPFMDGAYWSIMVEIIFYGWIFLLLATGLWSKRVAIVAGWLAVSVLNMVFLKSEALRMVLITEYAPHFAIGIMMFDMRERGPRIVTACIMATAFVAACLSRTLQVPGFVEDYGVTPDLTVLFSLIAIGVLLVALAIQPWDVSPRTVRIAAAAGAVSYPLYLFHQHAGYMLIDRLSPVLGNWGAAFAALIAVLGVAFATAELIERPMRPIVINTLLRLLKAVPLVEAFMRAPQHK